MIFFNILQMWIYENELKVSFHSVISIFILESVIFWYFFMLSNSCIQTLPQLNFWWNLVSQLNMHLELNIRKHFSSRLYWRTLFASSKDKYYDHLGHPVFQIINIRLEAPTSLESFEISINLKTYQNFMSDLKYLLYIT